MQPLKNCWQCLPLGVTSTGSAPFPSPAPALAGVPAHPSLPCLSQHLDLHWHGGPIGHSPSRAPLCHGLYSRGTANQLSCHASGRPVVACRQNLERASIGGASFFPPALAVPSVAPQLAGDASRCPSVGWWCHARHLAACSAQFPISPPWQTPAVAVQLYVVLLRHRPSMSRARAGLRTSCRATSAAALRRVAQKLTRALECRLHSPGVPALDFPLRWPLMAPGPPFPGSLSACHACLPWLEVRRTPARAALLWQYRHGVPAVHLHQRTHRTTP